MRHSEGSVKNNPRCDAIASCVELPSLLLPLYSDGTQISGDDGEVICAEIVETDAAERNLHVGIGITIDIDL